jgi:hypothetical protein
MTYYFRQKKKQKSPYHIKKKKQPFEPNPIAKPLTHFFVYVKNPNCAYKPTIPMQRSNREHRTKK